MAESKGPRPDWPALVSGLLKLIDTVRGDSEGRYPAPDPGCIECTSGAVPDDSNTGRCAEHAARVASASPAVLKDTQAPEGRSAGHRAAFVAIEELLTEPYFEKWWHSLDDATAWRIMERIARAYSAPPAAGAPAVPSPSQPAPPSRIVEKIKHVVCSACGWSDATVDVATGRSHCWRCGAEEDFTPEHVRRLIAKRIAPSAPSPTPSQEDTDNTGRAAAPRPHPLQRLSPEELAKIPPITREQIEAALEEGRKDSEALEEQTRRGWAALSSAHEFMHQAMDALCAASAPKAPPSIPASPVPAPSGSVEERGKELLQALRAARSVIDRDRTGLAAGLNAVRAHVRGSMWLARGEWGSYSYEQQTEATLRSEIGDAFDAIIKTLDDALHASGSLATEACREIDRVLRALAGTGAQPSSSAAAAPAPGAPPTAEDLDRLERLLSERTAGAWKLWGMDVMADQDGSGNQETAKLVARTFDPDRPKMRTFDASLICDLVRLAPALIASARAASVKPDWLRSVEGRMRAALHTMQGPVSDLEKRCHSDRPHNHDHLSALRSALRSLTEIHEKLLAVLPPEEA